MSITDKEAFVIYLTKNRNIVILFKKIDILNVIFIISCMNVTTGTCPICDAQVTLPSDTEESEVITCGDCKSRLVVEKISQRAATLIQAPEVEEDWGE